MTRNTHNRQYDHHGQDLDTNLIISASTTATTSGQSLHDAILDLETWVQTLGGTVASYALDLDDAGGGVTYVGEAAPGSTTSGADWRVKRITEVGSDITIEWADGDSDFDNVWDDRATLSYS